MYMVRMYNRFGNFVDLRLTETLERAETIRMDYIMKTPGLEYATFPTIWKYNGSGDIGKTTNYTRVLGY